ncbi:MAG: chemotaxis protein CheA [Acidimicrobiia bacterium]|nr:chemotaxis protein CheA [Acidimicrobiia bacterium]
MGQILRQRVDALAMRLVLANDDAGTAESMVQEVDALHRVAKMEGLRELAALAAELVAKARSSGAPLETLSEGLLRMQKALAEGDRRPSASGTPAAQSIANDPELIADFVLEAREHLDTIEGHLLALDKNPEDLEPVHAVFRSFHTIKGLAGFLNLDPVKDVAHEVETLLDLAREGKLKLTPGINDVILASTDYLMRWVKHLESGGIAGAPGPLWENQTLIKQILACMPGNEPAEPAPAAEAPAPPKTAESAPPPQPPPSTPLPAEISQQAKSEPAIAKSGPGRSVSVKVDTEKLDYLVDMVGEMVIAQSMVSCDPDLQANTRPRLARNLNQLGRITNEVQRVAMSMRMVEIGPLFQKNARLVRDLARKFGKQVVLETEGENVQVDRQIVEELSDALMHMVRNSLDHGVESPAERAAAGKDSTAKIMLRARHDSGQIVIQISDDGRGLNHDKILARARRNGIIGPTATLSESEVLNLIFQPGFSTAEVLSDISGRGVGLDVVRKQIQKLRGSVDIRSVQGKGSTFSLKLPLTLAIIDGLLVTLGGDRFIIPIFAVRELLQPKPEMITQVDACAEAVMVRDHLLPLVRLHERFAMEPRSRKPEDGVLVVSDVGGKDVALLVDEVIGKQEVVIKGLGPTFREVAGIAGGAILGDGHVGLILDMQGVFGARREE